MPRGRRRIQDEGGSIASASRAPRLPKSHAGGEAPQSRSTGDPDIVKSLNALLRKSGQPPGRLLMMQGTVEAATFRWDASPRPCSVAQIWRPADPTHQSNGAYVTYDSSRAVFLKCLHSECLKLNRGSGLFLGYLQCLPAGHVEANETPCAPSLPTRKRGCSVGSLTQSRGKRPQHCTSTFPILKAPNSIVQQPENPALPASIAAARADGSGGSLSSVTDFAEMGDSCLLPEHRYLTQEKGLLRIFAKSNAGYGTTYCMDC